MFRLLFVRFLTLSLVPEALARMLIIYQFSFEGFLSFTKPFDFLHFFVAVEAIESGRFSGII